MAGIYIHIPFCKKACHYCNFHFSTSAKFINQMVQSICIEAELRRNYINTSIATIYFGGGTPSLLQTEDLKLMMEKMSKLFLINDDAEITLEANPDDITKEKLAQWLSAGINRLSIGVQSFFEEDLRWMNRAHNAQQALQSITLAHQEGFKNITIDLMFGTPTLSDEGWKQNIHQALALNIPHLSCYALTVEPKTALQKMIQQHTKQNIDAEKQSRHFELLMQWLNTAGYEHYEISNYAKPGHRSKHNTGYWLGKTYMGLGPSAHSFNGCSRQWNIANNVSYLKNIQERRVPFEVEPLTQTQQLNEYIMTSLRTMEGLSLEEISKHWNKKEAEKIFHDADQWLKSENMIFCNNHLILTNKGKLFADGIASDLFR